MLLPCMRRRRCLQYRPGIHYKSVGVPGIPKLRQRDLPAKGVSVCAMVYGIGLANFHQTPTGTHRLGMQDSPSDDGELPQ